MSETTPNSKGPAAAQYTPQAAEPALIPVAEVNLEDVGKLSLSYVDGSPVLSVSDGTVITGGLVVVDASGNPVAEYTAGPVSAATQSRFASPDSWSPFGAPGLNLYAYCTGDPINMIDPHGN
ncbi:MULTISPECIES: RHS repeat-associated core domain-containing protein [Streptomyces]|uniref:RHS repeat-associated core domain-containing protein n=1 Tax=Streptomyces lonegramiae TaxID=3075524 RepID=A0ABU2XGR6_9ACTN|nr:RHS repeat-associated core domain-containing protein [Streptomyces sp. DSM 41529]MDT0544695.1 RHS repeat-associated core domain-containing protein [Streptomyces sp. DSM 41529]